jgi:D-methionine transport system permease protein
MAGFVGGGGLGDIAIRYGYNLGKTDVMLVMVVVLVAIVQLFQAFGGWFSRKNDRRIR